MKRAENPFDRFEIDPFLGTRGITERLRELALEASDTERAALRAAWEELTLHPARRLRAALGAHPETRAPLGAPPPPPREGARVDPDLTVVDLALRPSVALALGGEPRATLPFDQGSLEDDPILARGTDVR